MHHNFVFCSKGKASIDALTFTARCNCTDVAPAVNKRENQVRKIYSQFLTVNSVPIRSIGIIKDEKNYYFLSSGSICYVDRPTNHGSIVGYKIIRKHLSLPLEFSSKFALSTLSTDIKYFHKQKVQLELI